MERTQPTLQDLARHIAHVIPLFWVLVIAAAVISVGELALLVIAARRAPQAAGDAAPERRHSTRFAIAAVAGPVLLAGLVGVSIRIGHATVLRGLAATTPDENVKIVVAGLEAFTNVKALAPFLIGPVLLLATIAASLNAAATLNVRPRPLVTASLLFVGAGLSPFLLGAFRYTTQFIHISAGVAGVDVAMKDMMLTKGFEETLEILDWWAMAGTVGFGVALVIAIVMVIRAGVPPNGRPVSWRSPALCLAAAAALFLAAEPLRAENRTPWPAAKSLGAALGLNVLPTPEVDGPDELPPAELVALTNELTLGGGVLRNSEELRNMLVIMRNNYLLLHPADEADESLVIVCAPDTRTERLIEILQWAKLTEYRRPAFAFGKRTTLERPLMGTLPRWKWTAAKALIPGVGPEKPMPIVTLTVDDYPNCDAVARAVAAVRRSGKIAGLDF